MNHQAIDRLMAEALQCHRQGQFVAAESTYLRVLQFNPGHPDALHLLGLAARGASNWTSALVFIGRSIRLDPESALYRKSLGAALLQAGRREQAIVALAMSLVLEPQDPETHRLSGDAFVGLKRFVDAVRCFRLCVQLRPDHPTAYNDLGNAQLSLGRIDEAFANLRMALERNPQFSAAHNNLGNALRARHLPSEALASYRTALQLAPDIAEIWSNFGAVLQETEQCRAGELALRHALQLQPRTASIHINLANLLLHAGRTEEALASYRSGLALDPGSARAHSSLLLALHYHPHESPEDLAREHQAWNRHHAAPRQADFTPHLNTKFPERRLRLGYFSPDLRDHPIARFLTPLLQEHDRSLFEVHVFAAVPCPDQTTVLLKSLVVVWHDISALSDGQFADLVHQHQIDILIDLAGHTRGGRLPAFARKPAPIQVSYLGYPDTTGLDTMDYRIVDPWSDPEGGPDRFYSEKLLRLPATAWCYLPPEGLPEPKPSPRLCAGTLNFGSFNNLAKLSFQAVELWSEVLLAVPRANLVMKAKSFVDESVRANIIARFEKRGLAAHRLILLPWTETLIGHFSQYHTLDIALDSFPYHGTTTTCDALWMGVPVLTLAGQTHHSRVGVSLLHQLGLDRFVASTPREFVRLAVELANKPQELAWLHADLRTRMQRSPLMDAPHFARNIEEAFRTMWKKWCLQPTLEFPVHHAPDHVRASFQANVRPN